VSDAVPAVSVEFNAPPPGLGTPTFVEINAGPAHAGGRFPAAAFDASLGKLYIAAGEFSAAGEHSIAVYRCDPDGQNCLYRNLSSPAGDFTESFPSIQIDSLNNRVLIVRGGSNTEQLYLYRDRKSVV